MATTQFAWKKTKQKNYILKNGGCGEKESPYYSTRLHYALDLMAEAAAARESRLLTLLQ